MSLLTGLVDRLALVALIVVCGAVPSFVTQYDQQVRGRLAQARIDLQAFQSIADRYHDGDINTLVAHHLGSSDPSFRAEGDAIDAMLVQVRTLENARDALAAALPTQLWYLAGNAEPAIVRSTWDGFDPAFDLTPTGMLFALVAGGGLWLTLFGCVSGLRRLTAALWYGLAARRTS